MQKPPLIESFDGVVGLFSELSVPRADQNYWGDAVLHTAAEKPNIPLGLIIKIFKANDQGRLLTRTKAERYLEELRPNSILVDYVNVNELRSQCLTVQLEVIFPILRPGDLPPTF